MFKLVVLSALVAVAVAKPGAHLAQVVAPVAYAAPAATSYTYRQDVVSKPAVVATYAAAPVYQQYVAAPVVAKTIAVAPAAVSHTYRSDVISKPAVVSTYAHAAPLAYASPAAYAVPAWSYAAHAPAVHAW